MLSEAVVDGTRLVLTYNEDLDTDSVPGAEAFGVEADSTTVTVSDVAINGNAVTLTLGEPVAHGQTVELDYTVPTGSDARPMQDAAGNAGGGADQSIGDQPYAHATRSSVRINQLHSDRGRLGRNNNGFTQPGTAPACGDSH